MRRGFKPNVYYITCLFLSIYLYGFFVASAQDNSKKVSGTVTDQETEEGLPGATVIVEGTSVGTITDVDGNYSLELVGENPKLNVSFVGYETQVVNVGQRSTVNISLPLSLNELEEVTVVGYGTMRKRDLTGAVSTVKGADFEKANPISFQNALAGRVAGVQVTQTDNAPGAGVNIVIRGGSSLTGGNQPLYVIDGFPIIPDDSDPATNPLAGISTNQIESMEILKDASATAIYGAQGANGVIIITTKLGKKGKPRINVDVNYGVSVMDNPPDVLSPDEYVNFQLQTIDAYKYSAIPVNGNSVDFWQSIDERGLVGKNWIEEITRAANTTNMNVDFNGGSEGFKYALSANYLNQQGIVKRSGFERMNINTNLNQDFNKKIKIGSSIKISATKNYGLVNTWEEGAIIKTAIQSNPFIQDDFSFLDEINQNAADFAWNNENISNYINSVDNGFETRRMIANLFYEHKLFDDLVFYTSYGFNRYSKDQHSFLPIDTRIGSQIGGRVDFSKQEQNRFVYQARLNYNKTFGKHRLNSTAVFETTENNQTVFQTRIEGFEDDSRGIYDLSSAAVPYLPSNVYDENSIMSYLGRVNYNFDDKYLITASIRADASSKFGANNKWGYFPSVALGWVASDESFIQSLQVIDLLKLRASFGVTGNNQIPNYSSLARLQTQRYVFDENLVSGAVPLAVANPDLRWERTSQYNAGLDLGLFKSRVMITAEVYYKLTNDLLLEVQLPPTSGFTNAIQNIGSISNKGLEISINTVNIDKGDFSWTSALTFSANRSNIINLGDTDELFFTRNWYHRIRDDILVREGEQVGIYYGYIEDEIYNSGNEIANSPVNEVLENIVGQVKFYDVNGDGVVNQADKVPLAQTVPDFIGGLSNQFNYKNFDLSFFLRWSYGNDVVNGNLTYLDAALGFGGSWNTLNSYLTNNYTPLNPRGTMHGRIQDTYSSFMRSGVVEDGSFLKMDYVTLGYTLKDSNLLTRVGLRSLRVYGRVTNPFMLTRYSWFDPEVSTGWGTVAKVGPGVDVGTYPRSMTYSMGITIGL